MFKLNALVSINIYTLCWNFTSKGSYRSWKKIVKVVMMKEGIFAGLPSLAIPLPPLCLDCPCLTCPCPQSALHPSPPLTLAPLTLASKNGKTRVKTAKRQLKQQNSS